MISIRDTIDSSDLARYNAFMKQQQVGNTMTSFNLINGTIQIRIVRSKTLDVLAEDYFANNGLASQFIAEYNDAAKEIQRSRANVTARGIHGTPEPEAEVVA